MPDNDDNIVKFKPKGEKPVDPVAQQKKELMERVLEGGRRMRQRVRNQHIIYYTCVLVGFCVVFAVYISMIIGLLPNAN